MSEVITFRSDESIAQLCLTATTRVFQYYARTITAFFQSM